MTVLLYLDVANIDGRVSEGELNMMLAAAQGKTVDGEAKIGVCLDIDLRLKVGEGKPRHITDTGKPVNLIIAIPRNLRKEGRVFFLVRVHDGEAHGQGNRKAHGKARAEARCAGLHAAGPHDRVEL